MNLPTAILTSQLTVANFDIVGPIEFCDGTVLDGIDTDRRLLTKMRTTETAVVTTLRYRLFAATALPSISCLDQIVEDATHADLLLATMPMLKAVHRICGTREFDGFPITLKRELRAIARRLCSPKEMPHHSPVMRPHRRRYHCDRFLVS